MRGFKKRHDSYITEIINMKRTLNIILKKNQYHNIRWRSNDCGQHINTVGREISSLFGSVVDPVCPA